MNEHIASGRPRHQILIKTETTIMHAVVRETTYPEGMPIEKMPEFEAFQREHADLEGYVGSVVVDAGAGRHLTITLWRSAADMHAAREAMGPVVERTVNPVMTAATRLLGTGPVVANDLADAP